MSDTPPLVRRFKVTFTIRCQSYWTPCNVIYWMERFLCDREMITLQIEEVTPE